jgi:hypothetical protein
MASAGMVSVRAITSRWFEPHTFVALSPFPLLCLERIGAMETIVNDRSSDDEIE